MVNDIGEQIVQFRDGPGPGGEHRTTTPEDILTSPLETQEQALTPEEVKAGEHCYRSITRAKEKAGYRILTLPAIDPQQILEEVRDWEEKNKIQLKPPAVLQILKDRQAWVPPHIAVQSLLTQFHGATEHPDEADIKRALDAYRQKLDRKTADALRKQAPRIVYTVQERFALGAVPLDTDPIPTQHHQNEDQPILTIDSVDSRIHQNGTTGQNNEPSLLSPQAMETPAQVVARDHNPLYNYQREPSTDTTIPMNHADTFRRLFTTRHHIAPITAHYVTGHVDHYLEQNVPDPNQRQELRAMLINGTLHPGEESISTAPTPVPGQEWEAAPPEPPIEQAAPHSTETHPSEPVQMEPEQLARNFEQAFLTQVHDGVIDTNYITNRIGAYLDHHLPPDTTTEERARIAEDLHQRIEGVLGRNNIPYTRELPAQSIEDQRTPGQATETPQDIPTDQAEEVSSVPETQETELEQPWITLSRRFTNQFVGNPDNHNTPMLTVAEVEQRVRAFLDEQHADPDLYPQAINAAIINLRNRGWNIPHPTPEETPQLLAQGQQEQQRHEAAFMREINLNHIAIDTYSPEHIDKLIHAYEKRHLHIADQETRDRITTALRQRLERGQQARREQPFTDDAEVEGYISHANLLRARINQRHGVPMTQHDRQREELVQQLAAERRRQNGAEHVAHIQTAQQQEPPVAPSPPEPETPPAPPPTEREMAQWRVGEALARDILAADTPDIGDYTVQQRVAAVLANPQHQDLGITPHQLEEQVHRRIITLRTLDEYKDKAVTRTDTDPNPPQKVGFWKRSEGFRRLLKETFWPDIQIEKPAPEEDGTTQDAIDRLRTEAKRQGITWKEEKKEV